MVFSEIGYYFEEQTLRDILDSAGREIDATVNDYELVSRAE